MRHAWLTDVVREVHAASRATYGSRPVHAEVTLGRGIAVGYHQITALMRRAGLQGVTGKPKGRRGLPPGATAADLVDRRFARTGPNQLWVTDITEHPTREGKVYCAVVLDAYSRRVVGWSIDSSPTSALVTNALGMALDVRTPSEHTLIHSDQGVQFTSWAFTQRAKDSGLVTPWAASETASTTPSSNRSGRGCRSSYSTASDERPGSSSPTRSSTTSRSSTTANAATAPSTCAPRSNTKP